MNPFLTATFLIVLATTSITTAYARNSDANSEAMLQRLDTGTQRALSSPSEGVASLIETGLGFLGIRYRKGGNGPEFGGFDCSGLVKKVFGTALGLSLPRTAAEMAKHGDKVGRSGLIPGDLVFFNTMNRAFSHVGIYLGDNRFLHSPASGGVVRVERLDVRYWKQRFNGGRRLSRKAMQG